MSAENAWARRTVNPAPQTVAGRSALWPVSWNTGTWIMRPIVSARGELGALHGLVRDSRAEELRCPMR